MYARIATLLICLFTTNAGLTSALNIDALPERLSAELASGAVQATVVNGAVHSYASYQGFNAYAFERDGRRFALISYDVLAGSQWDVIWADPVPLSGLMYVEVPQFYTPGNTAQFTLYFSQLDPGIPANAFWSGQPRSTVVLQPDAMAAGSGIYEFSGEPDYIASGNMMFASFDDEPFLCIECRFFAQLNLVFLDYSTGILNFDFDDPRTTLFTGFDTYEGPPYGWGLDLVVNQVPLPAALPLMLAALASLGFTRRYGVTPTPV